VGRALLIVLMLVGVSHADELTLVREGRAAASIVVDERAGEPVRFAAEELRDYIAAMSGASLPIGGAGEAAIVLVSAHGEADGYTIQRVGNTIRLTGESDRAVLYAAYDLLEQLGVYFIGYKTRHGETVRRASTITIGDVSVATKPVMTWRFASDNNFAASDRGKLVPVVDWAAKNRCNAMMITSGRAGETWEVVAIEEVKKRGMMIVGPGHVLAQLTPDVKLAEKHAEYFPLIKGKRQAQVNEAWGGSPAICWSNAEAMRILVDNSVRYARAHAFIDVLAIFPPDGPQKGAQCQCDGCARLTMSGWYLRYLNQLVLALRAAGLHQKVMWIAYNELSVPPVDGGVKPVDEGRDFVLMWCNELRELHEPMESEANRRPPRLLEWKPALRTVKTDGKKNPSDAELSAVGRWTAWRDYLRGCGFGGDVVVLDYYNAHVGASLKQPWMLLCQSGPWPDGLMQKDFQFYVRETSEFRGRGWQNCTDYFNDGPSAYWNRLSAALMWEPGLDVERFDAAFCEQCYGPAGAVMREYCTRLWQLVGKTRVEAEDAEAIAALELLLKRAEGLANKTGDEDLLERMKQARSFHKKCVEVKRSLPAAYEVDGTPRERK
jgi:hypothetical protein